MKKLLLPLVALALLLSVQAEVIEVNVAQVTPRSSAINPIQGSVGAGESFAVEVIAHPHLPNVPKNLQVFMNYHIEVKYDPSKFQHLDTINLVPGFWEETDSVVNNDAGNPSVNGVVNFAMEAPALDDRFRSAPLSFAKISFKAKEGFSVAESVIEIEDINIVTVGDPFDDPVALSTITITEDDPGFDFGEVPDPVPPPPEPDLPDLTICTANFVCEEWSECGEDRQQSRNCQDFNNCKPKKIEKKACRFDSGAEPEEPPKESEDEPSVPATTRKRRGTDEPVPTKPVSKKPAPTKADTVDKPLPFDAIEPDAVPQTSQQASEQQPESNFIDLLIFLLILALLALVGYYLYHRHLKKTQQFELEFEKSLLAVEKYIRHGLSKNLNLNQIKQQLLQTGWSEEHIEKALANLNPTNPQ
jgi:hypothetical protein